MEVVRQWLLFPWGNPQTQTLILLKGPTAELIDDLCGDALIMFCLSVLPQIEPALQTIKLKTPASRLRNDKLICLLIVHPLVCYISTLPSVLTVYNLTQVAAVVCRVR